MSGRQHHSISLKGIALLLGICILAMPAIIQATEYGAGSPEALIERLKKAGEDKDFGEVAACIAPDDRAQMTMMAVVMTGFMIGMSQMGAEVSDDMSAEEKAQAEEAAKKGAELDAKFKAILEKHKATKLMDDSAGPSPDEDPAAAAHKALEGVDQVALIKDLFALMESVSDESGEGSMPVPAGEVKDLKVEWDRATAIVDEEEIVMLKIDGRWYLHMPMDM